MAPTDGLHLLLLLTFATLGNTQAHRWDAASALSNFACLVTPAVSTHTTGSDSNTDTEIRAVRSGNFTNSNVTFERVLSFGTSGGIPASHEILTNGENTTILRLTSNVTAGGAYSCVFQSGEDVKRITTLVQSSSVRVTPTRRTIRVSVNDPVTLQVQTDAKKVIWRKDGEPISDWRKKTTATIDRAQAIDSGFYECHMYGKRAEGLHGIVEVIVRGCPAGFWGQGCDEDCPNCLNGGLCDDVTGECVCPPGFTGQLCQNALGSNKFGQLGQFGCGQPGPDGGDSCRGSLVCLGHPYGCSCPAGYTGWDCLQDCQNGTYGADCEQMCHCHDNALCRGDTGSCDLAGGCSEHWTGDNCQVPVPRITSYPEPVGPNIGASIALTCTATVKYSNVSLGIFTPEGLEMLPVTTTRDVKAQTQTASVNTRVSRAAQSYECRLSTDDVTDKRTITVEGNEPPTLTQPPRTVNVESTAVELAWDAWDAAEDTGTGPVTGYLIYYREEAASSWQMAGNVTAQTLTFTVNSLSGATTYKFALGAERPGPNGAGALSPTVVARTECLAPDPISSLHISQVQGTATSLNVTWKPSVDSQCQVSYYIIHYDVMDVDQCGSRLLTMMFGTGQSGVLDTTGTNVIITGLYAYSTYSVTVAAGHRQNRATNVTEIATTGEDKPTSSPAPVELVDLSTSSATLTWGEVPCGHRRGAIINYLVQLRGAQPDTQIVSSSQHSYTFPDLKECVMYNFTVAAHTAAGLGPESFPTPIILPATTVPETVRNLRITASSGELHLSWDPPAQSACQLRYVVQYTPQVLDQCIQQLVERPTVAGEISGVTSFTIRGLVPYSTYKVQVLARNNIGLGTPISRTIRTAESVPENVTELAIVGVTEDTISLSWDLPCGDKHGNVLLFHYELFNEKAPLAALTEGTSQSNATSLTLANLASCTPYEFRVKAKTSAGYGRPSRLFHVRTEGGAPGTIGNVYVHTYPTRPYEADVTWSPPDTDGCPILYYTVHYMLWDLGMCETGSTQNGRTMTYAGNTSHWFIRLTDLEPYSQYEVYVQAVTEGGNSPVTMRRFQTKPAPPAKVAGIQVADRTQNSLTFSWNPLQCGDRHGPDIIYHYRLESSTGLVRKGQVQDPQAVATVYGLSPCMPYSFKIQAETMSGVGPPSESLAANTSAAPPGPVTALTAQTHGSSLNVSWSPPATQPCPIVSYGMRFFPIDRDQCGAGSVGGLTVRPTEVETVDTSAVVSGLVPFTTYSVIVYARTEASMAGHDTLIKITTPQDAPTSSPTVNDAAGIPGNPHQLNVSWAEVPCGHRRGNISFYAYELESLDDSKAKTSKMPATQRYVTFDDLEPCESYRFRIRARTKKGWGPYSGWKTLTTSAIVSEAVRIHQNETYSTGPHSVRLSWVAPVIQKCPITNYVVAYRLVLQDECLVDDDWPIEEVAVESDHKAVEISSLQPYSTYVFRVFAVTDAGNGSVAALEVRTKETVPSEPPADLTVDVITSQEIELSWSEPPCGARHGHVVHYQYRLLDTRNNRDHSAITTDTKIQFGNLTPFTEYRFSLRASSILGYGPFSQVLSIQTLAAPPPRPTALEVTGIGETNVTLKWKRPYPPHGVIREYKLVYWLQSDLTANETFEISINSKEERVETAITGLTPYTAYVFQVRGVTSAGPGDWSKEMNFGTSEGLPGPVTNVKIVNRTIYTIDLAWQAPKAVNGELLGYTISYGPVVKKYNDGASSTKRPVMSLRNSKSSLIQITELDPATEYIFRISANNKIGDGNVVIITEFTKVPAPLAPNSPSAASSVTEDSMVTIQLEAVNDSSVSGYQVTVQHLNKIAKREADSEHQRAMHPVHPGNYADSQSHWIAAEFPHSELPDTFTVGDNNTYGRYYNAPLAPGNSYGISFCSVSSTARDTASSCSKPIEVKAEHNPTSLSNAAVFPNELKAALGVILLVVMAAVLIVAVIRRRKRLHTTRPKEGIGLSALESGGEGNANAMTNGTSTTLPPLSRSQGVYKAKQRGLSVNAVPNGHQSVHVGMRRGNGAMRQRPKTAPKPANPGSMRSRWQAPPAVKIVELAEYVKEKSVNGEMCFKLDYERLPDGQMYTWEVATRQENVTKNRYINIIPYDHSRVILDTKPEAPHEDYINASFVSGYLRPKAYIATQGPLSTTVVDFWRMVWQEKVPIIVMLTKLVENKKRKCDPYWPEDIETYGDFTVTVVAERNYQHYTERTLTIRKAWDPEERRVQHFHYTSWPDMGLPLTAMPLLEFVQKVKEFEGAPGGPTIVHCSAGVGRTGTFITLDSMMDMSAREQQINVLDFIYRMRTKRVKMVQTPEQYVFIYEALLEYLLCGYTAVQTKSIVAYFTRMEQANIHTKRTFLEEHLQALQAMSICYSDMSMQAGKSAENIHKNRYPDIIPLDKYRPYLMTGCGEGQNNYVNATFLDGFKRRDMYIAAQMPMPHTVEDFWRMIYDYNSHVIVMLNDIGKNDQTCAQYWPAGDEALIGPFVIDVSAEEREGDISMRTFLLSNTNTAGAESSRVIRQYSLSGWKERQKYPKSLASLLYLLDLVEQGHRELGGDGPITVHCMDGVKRSGLFCAIMSTISKLKTEGIIDVFHAVKKLRKCGGTMVPSEEQYLYIHDVVREYLASCEIYENYR